MVHREIPPDLKRQSRPTTEPPAASQGTGKIQSVVVSFPLISPTISQVKEFMSSWISTESRVSLARRGWLANVLVYSRVNSSSRSRGNNSAPSVLHSAQHLTLLRKQLTGLQPLQGHPSPAWVHLSLSCYREEVFKQQLQPDCDFCCCFSGNQTATLIIMSSQPWLLLITASLENVSTWCPAHSAIRHFAVLND